MIGVSKFRNNTKARRTLAFELFILLNAKVLLKMKQGP